MVHQLNAEVGTLEPLGLGLEPFLAAAAADPIDFLRLQPLIDFRQTGGTLSPGQLLSVYPPFVIRTDTEGRTYQPLPAAARLRSLATLAREIRDLPDGTRVRIKAPPSDGA